MKVNNIMKWKV